MPVSATAEASTFILMVGGGGSDGGGWGLTAGGKLKRIPDNNPGLKKLRIAANLLTQAEAIDDSGVARSIREAATSLASRGAKDVTSKIQ